MYKIFIFYEKVGKYEKDTTNRHRSHDSPNDCSVWEQK